MAIKILMPALSPTMLKGNIAKWLKKEGEQVKSGEVIAEIETDKAIMEVESADNGILGKILVPEKTNGVMVGKLIAILLEKGDDESSIDSLISEDIHLTSNAKEPNLTASKVANVLVEENLRTPIVADTQRVFASPLARRIANQRQIDISNIKGTGPKGRIIKEDVLKYDSNLGSQPNSFVRNSIEYKVVELTQMRKTIAERLQESKSTIPHFYLTIDCETDELLSIKNYLNSKISADKLSNKISLNDIIVKITAATLAKVPEVNAGWLNDTLVQFNNIDISIAIAIPDGLITPIIKNADRKSFAEISSEIKDLANKAKSMQLKPHEFMGGSFTISNLGMYGIKEFQAIINPPQAAILSVGASYSRAVVKDGVVRSATIMTVSISCDHRVIDGAIAAEFMQQFKEFIEHPIKIFI